MRNVIWLVFEYNFSLCYLNSFNAIIKVYSTDSNHLQENHLNFRLPLYYKPVEKLQCLLVKLHQQRLC